MASTNLVIATPEVVIDRSLRYLIRKNGAEYAFVDDESTAVAVIDSIAASAVKAFQSECQKAVREDLDNGKRVCIRVQALGRVFNGNFHKVLTVDMVPVPRAILVKLRTVAPTEVVALSEEVKTEVKAEVKAEIKEEVKEEAKAELKEAKAETKVEVKEEVKAELKTEIKEAKAEESKKDEKKEKK